jgi:hypothetical protein
MGGDIPGRPGGLDRPGYACVLPCRDRTAEYCVRDGRNIVITFPAETTMRPGCVACDVRTQIILAEMPDILFGPNDRVAERVVGKMDRSK